MRLESYSLLGALRKCFPNIYILCLDYPVTVLCGTWYNTTLCPSQLSQFYFYCLHVVLAPGLSRRIHKMKITLNIRLQYQHVYEHVDNGKNYTDKTILNVIPWWCLAVYRTPLGRLAAPLAISRQH